MAGLGICAALALACAAAELDFAALEAEFRARCGPVAGVEQALAQCFEALPLGALEVYLPKDGGGEDGGDAEAQETVRRALGALIDVQGAWLEAFAPAEEQRRWEPLLAGLREANEAGELAGAPQAAELAELLADERLVGFAPVSPRKARVVLAPTRREFQRLVAFFGSADPSLRPMYWQDGARTWSEFWWNEIQVVALEYPPVQGDTDDLRESTPMDAREETGLEQHVAQRGAVALLWKAFGGGLAPALELGLAHKLVVDLYGENNARSGSPRGSSTAAFAAFVPGGNPAGGVLPPSNADSAWRAGKGEDYFVEALRAGQKAGAKELERGSKKEEALAWFLLRGPDGKHAVRAPFLGAAARGKPPPPEGFAGDYLEFFRAYRTAFAHWLVTEGAGRPEESKAAWRALARAVAAERGKGDFEEQVARVYGVPLGAGDGIADSLEGRFLAWLSKQR